MADHFLHLLVCIKLRFGLNYIIVINCAPYGLDHLLQQIVLQVLYLAILHHAANIHNHLTVLLVGLSPVQTGAVRQASLL